MTLLQLVQHCLCHNIMAAEFYRTQLARVPIWMQPTIYHFEMMEERHAARFAKLIYQISGQEPRAYPIWKSYGHLSAKFSASFGLTAILKSSHRQETKAIHTYQQALGWVRRPDVRSAINQVLKDEELHDRLIETLTLFHHDGQKHLHELHKLMVKLESKQ